jgi:hypothetical protein
LKAKFSRTVSLLKPLAPTGCDTACTSFSSLYTMGALLAARHDFNQSEQKGTRFGA